MQHETYDRRLENMPTSTWEKIAQIDELKGRWVGGVRLGPQVLGRLKQSVLITSTGASTRIEGARLSDEDVEKLMRGIAIQKFSDRDQQEVTGYFELLTNVFDSWERLRFSEGLIKHFHRELLKYVDKDISHRGEYKHRENKVHISCCCRLVMPTCRMSRTKRRLKIINPNITSPCDKASAPFKQIMTRSYPG